MDAMDFKSVFMWFIHILQNWSVSMQPNTLQQVWRWFLRWFKNSSIQNTSINAYKQFSYNVIYLESESILVGRSACKAQQELWIALDLRSSSTSNHFEYLLPQSKPT